MQWGIYARDGFEGALAFRRGLVEAGHQARLRSLSDHAPGCTESFDAVAVFGLRGKGDIIRADYAGTPVVVVDYGYLRRVHGEADFQTGHWQVGLGGLNQLPPWDCPPGRFDALGLRVEERGGDPNGYALICPQMPGDAAHGCDLDAMATWVLQQAERFPNARIRPHPKAPELTYGLPLAPPDMGDALAGARLVVTGNSNMGHDALLAGVPVISTFPGAAWESLSGEQLPDINQRLAHFYRCAWGQWTWQEFRSGTAARFLVEHLLPNRPPKW